MDGPWPRWDVGEYSVGIPSLYAGTAKINIEKGFIPCTFDGNHSTEE